MRRNIRVLNGAQHQPKQKRTDEKKSRILEAALELFASHGFHGTNAKAIAARAGVATGTFYPCFRDNKAAFMAVCLRMEMEEDLGSRMFDSGRRMREEGGGTI